MPETRFLISLLGEAALLLWGAHMVQSGVMRAFGGELRRVLSLALGDRIRGFLAGIGVTAALQSSTAVGLMAAAFTADGAVALTPALGLMLGAGVGSAVIVQAFSFDLSFVFPLFIFAGLIAFRVGQGSRTRDLGRVGIGLGIMLLSLKLLVATANPGGASSGMQGLISQITGDAVFDILLAAIAAWAAHSSVAIVLVIMSLAGSGVVTPEAAMALVLGANLGSAINPVLETGGQDRARLRLPVANLAMRLVACIVVTPFLPVIAAWMGRFALGPEHLAANFHLAFNLGLAVVFLPLLTPVTRLARRFLPQARPGDDPSAPRHLDRSVLDSPQVAIANAARETLRMADTVELMIRGAEEVLRTGDRRRLAEVGAMDDTLDLLHRAIERYLSDVDTEDADDAQQRRLAHVLSYATNLEHAGDITAKSLLSLASKRIKRKLTLSPDGMAEIIAMHEQLLVNLQLAVSIFMNGDAVAAQRLVEQKRRFKDMEQAAARAHFERIRQDLRESMETSGLHLDIIRDLTRINSHLAACAYPVLQPTAEPAALAAVAAAS